MTSVPSAPQRPRRIDAPASAAGVLDANYADAFSIASDTALPAITRTRLAFTDLPPVLRTTIRTAWRRVLGLRLADAEDADDAEHVVGWAVAHNAPERLVLRAGSRLIDVALVVDALDDRTTITTLVRYHNPAGRVAWLAVAPVHRRVAPVVLVRGRRAIEAHAAS